MKTLYESLLSDFDTLSKEVEKEFDKEKMWSDMLKSKSIIEFSEFWWKLVKDYNIKNALKYSLCRDDKVYMIWEELFLEGDPIHTVAFIKKKEKEFKSGAMYYQRYMPEETSENGYVFPERPEIIKFEPCRFTLRGAIQRQSNRGKSVMSKVQVFELPDSLSWMHELATRDFNARKIINVK